jgi:glycosyl transferase family 25
MIGFTLQIQIVRGIELQRFVVNLDRSPERMERFLLRTERLGLEFIRISAVDGRNLTESTLKKFHRRCPANRAVSYGELGCFLSHLAVWTRIASAKHAWSFVAEDDFHFSADAKLFLESDEWLPSHVQLLKAETMQTTVRMSSVPLREMRGIRLRWLRSYHGGTAGYFISSSGASKLIELAEYHCEPVDHFIFGQSRAQRHQLAIAQMDPAIGIQAALIEDQPSSSSELDFDREEFWNNHPLSRKPRGLRKIARELQRVAKDLSRPAYQAILTAMGDDVFRKVPLRRQGTDY